MYFCAVKLFRIAVRTICRQKDLISLLLTNISGNSSVAFCNGRILFMGRGSQVQRSGKSEKPKLLPLKRPTGSHPKERSREYYLCFANCLSRQSLDYTPESRVPFANRRTGGERHLRIGSGSQERSRQYRYWRAP